MMLYGFLPLLLAAVASVGGAPESNSNQLLPGPAAGQVRGEGPRGDAVRPGMRRDGADPRLVDELRPSRRPDAAAESTAPVIAIWLPAALLGLPGAYLLSFGPACWLAWNVPLRHGEPTPIQALCAVYRPVVVLVCTGPRCISVVLSAYLRAFRDGENGRHLMAVALGLESLRPAEY